LSSRPSETGARRLRHLDEFLDAAAEDRGQQEAIIGDLECLEAGQRGLGAGVGQAHGIDETARGVLRVDRLAVAGAGREADALGRDHADLRHLVEKVLDDRRGRGDDAGGDREGPGQGFAEKFDVHDGYRAAAKNAAIIRRVDCASQAIRPAPCAIRPQVPQKVRSTASSGFAGRARSRSASS
jgi:hypothetical protein